MPRKYSLKTYIENGYYHIYNRGVEKRKIFLDDQDFRVFLHLLKYYLSPTNINDEHPLNGKFNYNLKRPRPISNLYGKVDLIAYCLMPNHFHLLIKQVPSDGMKNLMSKLTTTYSMYFNKRYERVGYLFQGNYKAVNVDRENYLLHLSRYIHLNPVELTGVAPVNYPYSSYQYYLNEKNANWIKPKVILDYFKSENLSPFLKSFKSYKNFVEEYKKPSKDILDQLSID